MSFTCCYSSQTRSCYSLLQNLMVIYVISSHFVRDIKVDKIIICLFVFRFSLTSVRTKFIDFPSTSRNFSKFPDWKS